MLHRNIARAPSASSARRQGREQGTALFVCPKAESVLPCASSKQWGRGQNHADQRFTDFEQDRRDRPKPLWRPARHLGHLLWRADRAIHRARCRDRGIGLRVHCRGRPWRRGRGECRDGAWGRNDPDADPRLSGDPADCRGAIEFADRLCLSLAKAVAGRCAKHRYPQRLADAGCDGAAADRLFHLRFGFRTDRRADRRGQLNFVRLACNSANPGCHLRDVPDLHDQCRGCG